MKKHRLHPSPGSGGFTLIEILVVAAVMVVMSTLGIAGLNYQRQRAAGMACGNNLRLVQEAKRAALEDDPTLTTFDNATLCKYLPGGVMPNCPGGGTYQDTDSLGTASSCSLNNGVTGMHNLTVAGAAGGSGGGLNDPGSTTSPGGGVTIGIKPPGGGR